MPQFSHILVYFALFLAIGVWFLAILRYPLFTVRYLLSGLRALTGVMDSRGNHYLITPHNGFVLQQLCGLGSIAFIITWLGIMAGPHRLVYFVLALPLFTLMAHSESVTGRLVNAEHSGHFQKIGQGLRFLAGEWYAWGLAGWLILSGLALPVMTAQSMLTPSAVHGDSLSPWTAWLIIGVLAAFLPAAHSIRFFVLRTAFWAVLGAAVYSLMAAPFNGELGRALELIIESWRDFYARHGVAGALADIMFLPGMLLSQGLGIGLIGRLRAETQTTDPARYAMGMRLGPVIFLLLFSAFLLPSFSAWYWVPSVIFVAGLAGRLEVLRLIWFNKGRDWLRWCLYALLIGGIAAWLFLGGPQYSHGTAQPFKLYSYLLQIYYQVGLVVVGFFALYFIVHSGAIHRQTISYVTNPENHYSVWGHLYIILLAVLPKNVYSKLVGLIAGLRLPRFILIPVLKTYARIFKVDVNEAELELRQYDSLNAFFIRTLRAGARLPEDGRRIAVAPADGRLLSWGDIQGDMIWQVKGKEYSLDSLLGNDYMLSRLHNGSYATVYLSPSDYHRVHSPLSGEILGYYYIPGKLFPVNQFAVWNIGRLFSRNERVIIYLQTQYGVAAVILVGATSVGKIGLAIEDDFYTNRFINKKMTEPVLYQPPRVVKKGDELGRFELGSTVIVLFEDKMEFPNFETGDRLRWGSALCFYPENEKRGGS